MVYLMDRISVPWFGKFMFGFIRDHLAYKVLFMTDTSSETMYPMIYVYAGAIEHTHPMK